jgi:hypothetical protein
MRKIITLLLLVMPLLQGCITQRIMESEDRKNYSSYIQETQRVNLEREKAGLKPETLMTYEQWKGLTKK